MTVTKIDHSDKVFKAIAELTKSRLLVGIPDSAAARPAVAVEKNPPSSALVGYVMEFGAPEKNIPARPFLVPGVEDAKGEIVDAMTKGARAAFEGKSGAAEKALHAAGFVAEEAVRKKILSGPFAPLSERTIRERAERRYEDTGKLVNGKSNREARQFRKLQAQGVPDEVLHDAGLAQPLVDTRSLLGSIRHVIRSRSNGR